MDEYKYWTHNTVTLNQETKYTELWAEASCVAFSWVQPC